MENIAENCKIFQKFGVSRQIVDKVGAQLGVQFSYIIIKSKKHKTKHQKHIRFMSTIYEIYD